MRDITQLRDLDMMFPPAPPNGDSERLDAFEELDEFGIGGGEE